MSSWIFLKYLYICISRPGRRPLGFLSLICSKNSLESDAPIQVHSKKRLKPLIPVSRKNLKRSKPPVSESQKKIQESSDRPSSPSVDNTQPENIGSSAAQVCDICLLLFIYNGSISDSTRNNVIVIIIWISEIIAEQILSHLLHIIPTPCTTVLEEDMVLN